MRCLAATAAALLLAGPVAACTTGDPVSERPASQQSTSEPTAERSRSEQPTGEQPTGEQPTPGEPTARPDARKSPGELLADVVRDGPERARTPAEVVRQIVAAERAIADPRTRPRVLEAAGRLQQLAYRVLGERPRWDARVRAGLPAGLPQVVDRNVRARRAFRSMHHQLSDELPAWRIVRPARAARLKAHYQEAERRFGVDWEYLAAINLVETAMGRIRGTSTAGAQGPMQFLPSTWASYGAGGDINATRDAILAAGRFLRAQGFRRSVAGALYRYNNSTAYVRGVTELATVMQERPRAFLGYYHWQVYFVTSRGDVLLPVGYAAREPIPVGRWLADHPQP
jgi:soluble lytic murein transglycosylase-like protein